mmetsp:Transcript_4694/g.14321  ORF Transcript_4694/g.14321 Transcript_4694/m.14321 type:complete len:225 (-) Transcript_4694:1250-1924(-)
MPRRCQVGRKIESVNQTVDASRPRPDLHAPSARLYHPGTRPMRRCTHFRTSHVLDDHESGHLPERDHWPDRYSSPGGDRRAESPDHRDGSAEVRATQKQLHPARCAPRWCARGLWNCGAAEATHDACSDASSSQTPSRGGQRRVAPAGHVAAPGWTPPPYTGTRRSHPPDAPEPRNDPDPDPADLADPADPAAAAAGRWRLLTDQAARCARRARAAQATDRACG